MRPSPIVLVGISLYNVVCLIGLCVKHVILSDFRQDFAPKWIIERAFWRGTSMTRLFYDFEILEFRVLLELANRPILLNCAFNHLSRKY